MNCLKCELTRARIKAAYLAATGTPFEDIAEILREKYGDYYCVVLEQNTMTVYRVDKLPPFTRHGIIDKVMK